MNNTLDYLNSAPSILFHCKNSTNYPIIYVSENVTDLFDASVEEFLNGKITFADLVHPDDMNNFMQELNEAITNNLSEFRHTPYRIKSRRGWIWIDHTTKLIRDAENRVIEYYNYVTDLSAVKELEQQLEELRFSNSTLMRALDKNYLVSKANLKGNITFVNDKFCEVSGYSREELLGNSHNIVKHPDNEASVFKELWKRISNKKMWHGIIKNRAKDGSAYYVNMTIKPILDNENNITEYIAIRHEITDLIEEQLKQAKILRESSLLKVPNRVALMEQLTQDKEFIAAQIDIDAFHELNDFFGYSFGDEILIKLLETIQEDVTDSIEIYHLQADQFILLSDRDDYRSFESTCIRLQHLIHQKSFKIDNDEVSIRVTVVVSDESYPKLLRSLNMAYEYAKKHSESFLRYSSKCDFSENYNKNLESLHKVKLAFESDRIIPYFQAIYNNKTQKIEKYEVLARLIEKDGKVLTPYFFLDAIYKAKMNQRLTKTIIRKAFAYFYDCNMEFSINLSLSDMLDANLVSYIIKQLENFSEPHRVVFEILESEGIENFELVSKFITQVKEHGCKIAIDDFGSGYANFENLIKLDADIIKLDGSLIKEMPTNEDAKDIVEIVNTFAKKKGILTVAEFVSSEEIMNIVKELHIDYSQGYYIHEPSAKVDKCTSKD